MFKNNALLAKETVPPGKMHKNVVGTFSKNFGLAHVDSKM
jgi:hypothetical protein